MTDKIPKVTLAQFKDWWKRRVEMPKGKKLTAPDRVLGKALARAHKKAVQHKGKRR